MGAHCRQLGSALLGVLCCLLLCSRALWAAEDTLTVLTPGVPAAGAIAVANQIDFFQIDAVGEEPLYIGLTKATPWSASIEVRQGNIDGTVVAQVDGTNDLTVDQWLEIAAPTVGPYFIRLQLFNPEETVTTPLAYTITAGQQWPVLSANPTDITLSGLHSLRWFKLPASEGQPLYAFADHNSENSVSMEIVQGSLSGTSVASITGVKDQLIYLPSAGSGNSFLKVYDATVTGCRLTAGAHLPLVTGEAAADGVLANAADIHWYEVPVAAGEEALLHLDKQAAFSTVSPILFTSPINPQPDGTASGDVTSVLKPASATTYFARVTGGPGRYRLSASRKCAELTLGEWADAAMAHAGDERWFEVTIPANKPFFLMTNKEREGEPLIEVYRQTLQTRVLQFTSAVSEYRYLPPRSTATRYIIRKRAPETTFVSDSAERLYVGTSLPKLAPGQTKTGTIAGRAQRWFYQLDMGGRPIVLQPSLPVQVEEPGTGRSLQLSTPLAIAGMSEPAVVVVASQTACNYTVSATADLHVVNTLFFRNAFLEATVDLAKTTVGRVKHVSGSNTYLNGDGETAQNMLVPEGTEYTTGWDIVGAAADANGLQITWRHAATQVNKTLMLHATAQKADICCQVDTPRAMTFRNAIMPPSPAGSTHAYAVPVGNVTSNTYTQSGTTALYPSVLGGMISPTERWVAFWNSAVDEVYGVTLSPQQRIALSTDGAYTVTRVLCPAGRSAFTMTVEHPKPSTPYQVLQNGAAHPVLAVEHYADTSQVPAGSVITGTLSVRNVGSGTATDVVITCDLPAATSYVNDSASSGGTYNTENRTLTWRTSALVANAERSFTYRYTIDPAVPLGTVIDVKGAGACTEQAEPVVSFSYTTVTPPTLIRVTPATPGNTGPVTFTVQGTCLSESSVVTLSQAGQTLTGQNIGLRPDRTELRVLIDVTGTSGVWDMAVTNPGGSAASLSSAVSFAAGGQDIFWCNLTAPRTLVTGAWTTVQVQYGNRGTVDAVDRLLALYLPPARFAVNTVHDEHGNMVAASTQSGSLNGPLLFVLPHVGPGASQCLHVELKALTATGGTGVYPNATLAVSTLTRQQLGNLLDRATAELFSITAADRPALTALISASLDRGLASWSSMAAQPLWSVAGELVTQLRSSTTLAHYLTQTDAATTGAIVERMLIIAKAGGDIPPLAVKSEYLPTLAPDGVGNLMTGPLGVSGPGYVMTGQPFDYRITCTNPAQATAAVKEIVVTDVLESTLDWTTLRLGAIRIGNKLLDVSGEALPFHGYLDLRPEVGSMAEVTITFDQERGILIWRVLGYHPVTSAKYDLLLPNTAQNAPLGTAEMTFSILPKSALASGVLVKNKASITFDGGAPVLTNEAANTIDAGPPSSAVRPLPQVQEDAAFTVEWGGQDDQNGSGLRAFSVFVSDNGESYTCWQNRVTTTSATYTGSYGHTYSFYSIAEDAIGYRELPPATPDAEIKIGRDMVMGKGLRLVSVPIRPTTADPKLVMGFAEAKWARYAPSTGYVTYGNDPNHLTWFEPATSVPGRAYWGFWDEDRTIDVAGTVPTPNVWYAIDLESGWNLIGNPWTKRITWDTTAIKVTSDGVTKTLADAAALGWIRDYAWGWVPATPPATGGQYWMVADASVPAAKHQLEAWQGYWIKTTRACKVLLPPPSQSPAPAAARNSRRLLSQGWQVRLLARGANGEDGFNWFGMGSREDLLRLRAIESPPPALTPTVELSFQTGDSARAVDLRETGTANPVWHFTVASPQAGEELTLCWPDLTLAPTDTGLVLINELTGERRNMRTTDEYRFTAPRDGGVVPFRIETANRGLLRVLSLSAASSASRAGGAHIRYTLSQEATATVEVRTVTGKLVRTLTGTRAAANTPASITWDGSATNNTKVPRGMYLLILMARADDGTSVRAVTPCSTL